MDRSAIGKNNRRKGCQYERDIAQEFRSIGFFNAKTSRSESKHRDDQKVDIMFTEPYNIQAKATNICVNYINLLAEMPKEEGHINCVFNRVKNRGEYVILKQEDFLELIKRLESDSGLIV